jgi:glycosyltransferase involved in cell wall biosynthesis
MWGKEDMRWYRTFFEAAEKYGCPVIENINIPTEPFISTSVKSYVYVSHFVKEKFSIANHPNEVIFPGSDFRHFNREELSSVADNCIGMVYRLERDKINERSIDVFIEVVKRRKGTKALIVGGGVLLEHYKKAVHDAGLSHFFTFTGYVSYMALPEQYKKMSVFVAPVHRESFGQVTPFAMSMSLPVAGYHVGALPEIIADDALLASPGDHQGLADIIIDLLNSRDKRKQIGARNYKRAHALFSVENMIQSYHQLYHKVILETQAELKADMYRKDV